MKFKNYIEVQSGIKDSADSPGTLDQILTSTATGVAWVDPSTISAEAATLVVIECKNTSGATITKGTPVYQTGTVGATDVIEIAPADALISAGSQPAIGLLQTTLNNNGFGKVVITGEFLNFTTDPIDGVTPTTGDKVFLKSGGGLTLTKPTGAENGIQNLGLIGKVSGGNAGSITVSSIMRTNDVPNLPTGKIWVGDGNTTVSDTVFLDEPNGRMGIGTTSPQSPLHIYKSLNGGVGGELRLDNNNGAVANKTRILFSDGGGASGSFDRGAIVCETEASPYMGQLQFQTGVGTISTKMIILGNGNVGIGTTSPSEKLDVAGNIKLSGVLYVGSRGIYQAQNTDVDGLELVANASINLYRAAFFDYVIQKQGNVRAGTVFACNDGGSVEYTETSTNDIGDTSDVVLSVDISGTNMRLLADAATSGWSVKSLIRAI